MTITKSFSTVGAIDVVFPVPDTPLSDDATEYLVTERVPELAPSCPTFGVTTSMGGIGVASNGYFFTPREIPTTGPGGGDTGRVPEPASLLLLGAGLAGLGVLGWRRRRS